MPPSTTGSPMGTNDLQKIRDYHTNNLLQKYPTARIIAPDKVDVPVKLNNGQYLNFRVYLNATFPQLPPIIQLLATAAPYVYLDKNQLVIHERLRRWTPQDHLGEVLFQVFQEISNNPPRIINYVMQPVRTGPSPPLNQPIPSTQPYPQQTSLYPSPTLSSVPQSQPIVHVSLPPIPDVFPEVDEIAKNPAQLKQLVDSEWEFKKWFDQLAYVKSTRKIYEDLREKNIEMAKAHIERNKALEAKSTEFENLKEEMRQLRVRIQEKSLKQKQINDRYQPLQVLQILNQKIDELETETENMAIDFSSKSVDWDNFCKDYMSKRSLYHLRKEKKQRFTATYVK